MGIVVLRVDKILAEKNISVADFSEKAGINYRTALDIVKGRYDRIGMDTIAKICDALDIRPGDIFDYKQGKEPD